MTALLWLTTLLGIGHALRLSSQERLQDDPTGNYTYTCPSVSRPFRADTQVEFFTLGRRPGDSSWPVVSAEVPTTYQEFMCGIVNRTLPVGCSTNCGFLLQWQTPSIRTFNFTSVQYDSDVYFLDRFKTVISTTFKNARDTGLVTSTGDMVYTLLVPKGSLSGGSVAAASDPARIPPLPMTAYLGGNLMVPNGLPGLHN